MSKWYCFEKLTAVSIYDEISCRAFSSKDKTSMPPRCSGSLRSVFVDTTGIVLSLFSQAISVLVCLLLPLCSDVIAGTPQCADASTKISRAIAVNASYN